MTDLLDVVADCTVLFKIFFPMLGKEVEIHREVKSSKATSLHLVCSCPAVVQAIDHVVSVVRVNEPAHREMPLRTLVLEILDSFGHLKNSDEVQGSRQSVK